MENILNLPEIWQFQLSVQTPCSQYNIRETMEKINSYLITRIVLSFVAVFFIFFGINLLYMAYQLNDPFNFIMTFFASNLIILISIALLLGFIIKIVHEVKKKNEING